ncbi:hypothetical protein LK09_00420 [Microbacterium mangrovi]|uniref:Glycosyltransferase 2-like domain-containing protein n=1 Tax=Microbacterium mangrovi TaxID=1348253 RepID=A0A0B2A8H9_9MICO|nr:glycosyltransferase family 2 protein [Microbacterium mangrovi]KHK99843.1 hypothetical protein LK09_00420 [Microbacterium mangrovi]
MNRPISVVIPHYGDTAPALALIDMLWAQTDAPAIELVLVDDASPEAFPDTPGVRVVRRTRNGGFGAAVNTGLRAAEHDRVLVLNSDLEVAPGFVGGLVRAAEPWMPAVCGCALVGPDGDSQWAGRIFPRTSQYVIEWLTPLARFRPRLHRAVGHDTSAVPGVVTPVDWVVGAVLLLPRSLVLDAGGFDEGFHMNCEEVDLQRRLRALGVVSVFLGTVTATHVGGGSSDDLTRRTWVMRSRHRYARKWGEAPRVLRAALTAASAVNLVSNAVRRAAGRDVAPVAVFRRELSLLRCAGAAR